MACARVCPGDTFVPDLRFISQRASDRHPAPILVRCGGRRSGGRRNRVPWLSIPRSDWPLTNHCLIHHIAGLGLDACRDALVYETASRIAGTIAWMDALA